MKRFLLVLVLVSVACGVTPSSPASSTARCPTAPPRASTQIDADDVDPRGEVVPAPSAAPTTDFGNVRFAVGELLGVPYLEAVFGDAAPEEPMPLIVGIHGLGGRPELPYPPYEGLVAPVRVISPRGPRAHGAGFSWLPVRVAEGKTAVLSRALREQAGRLAAFLQALPERYRTTGKPIVTGFSQGGMLTFSLAVLHPDVVGEAFPLAGWLPPPLIPESPDEESPNPPIRSMHSRDDRVVPIGPTRESVARLQGLGLDVEMVEFDGAGHSMSDEMDDRMRAWMNAALARASAAPHSDRSSPASARSAAADR